MLSPFHNEKALIKETMTTKKGKGTIAKALIKETTTIKKGKCTTQKERKLNIN